MIGGNPALNENTFDLSYDLPDEQVMTMEGTVAKSAVLVGLTVTAAAVTWGITTAGGVFDAAAAMPWLFGGAIGGLILALITIFSPKKAPVTAPLYAIFEGLFLGAISAWYEASFGAGAQGASAGMLSGIVVQAAGLTFSVLAVMLILYATRIIRVTEKLRAGIIAATGAVVVFYVAAMVLRLFGMNMPFLNSPSPLGIGISLVIVGIAAFNLLLDFDLIERGCKQGSPKYMEWYAGFSLLVTLVWLYLEILRLLSKLRSR